MNLQTTYVKEACHAIALLEIFAHRLAVMSEVMSDLKHLLDRYSVTENDLDNFLCDQNLIDHLCEEVSLNLWRETQ